MAPVSRRVRRLRLRGASEGAVRRVASTLEDALRTASLHDEGGRILLVRRLALGALPPRARSEEMARTLEGALRDASTDARHGTDPAADRANVVWFADALEAHLALALRLLQGAPPRAWYWRLVTPEWRPEVDVQTGLAALARSLAALPEAPTALPAWVEALARAGHRATLVAALDPVEARALTEAMGPDPSGRSSVPSHGVRSMDNVGGAGHQGRRAEPPPTVQSAAAEAAERFVADALRAAAMGEPAPHPGHPGHPGAAAGASGIELEERRGPVVELPPIAASVHGHAHGEGEPMPDAPAHAPSGPTAADDAVPRRVRSAERPTAVVGPGVGRNAVPAKPARPRAARASAASDRGERAEAASPRWPGLSATGAGGVLFLLNVLIRLEHATWLERNPRWRGCHLARRVLDRVLDALRVAEEDPIRTLTRVPAGSTQSGDGGPPEREAVVVRAWSLAVHGWLRRHGAPGVVDLVLRPGRLALTRTHVDLWLDPKLCDLRIRRAGLDLDPGWLPWLGRVVAFHYGPEEAP